MQALELLKLKQLRFQIASDLVLQKWRPESISQQQCPFCNSLSKYISRRSKRPLVWRCRQCDGKFKALPAEQQCQCSMPGCEPYCRGCPNFDRFMELVQEQLTELEPLSVKKLYATKREVE